MKVERIKVHLVLTVLFLEIYLQHFGRCSKIMSRVFLSYKICIVLLFDQLRSLLIVKSLQNVIHDKLVYYIIYFIWYLSSYNSNSSSSGTRNNGYNQVI